VRETHVHAGDNVRFSREGQCIVELTVAICTFNRAARMPVLIRSLCAQRVDVPWEILVIDNNSTDNTRGTLESLMKESGGRLRVVSEPAQGIVHARNRAIAESLGSTYLLFMDDDELPAYEGMLQAALDTFRYNDAMCVGGKISICFEPGTRPAWLGDDLMLFLGKVDYGSSEFWIRDESTPVWSGNVAYKTSLFRDDPTLRFDMRYNRAGQGIGGGEDKMMFLELLSRGVAIRYQPAMEVLHFIEPFKLKRRYFLNLHFLSGFKDGRYDRGKTPKDVFGIPPYMVRQAFEAFFCYCEKIMRREKTALRQGMVFTYILGAMYGRFISWRETHASSREG